MHECWSRRAIQARLGEACESHSRLGLSLCEARVELWLSQARTVCELRAFLTALDKHSISCDHLARWKFPKNHMPIETLFPLQLVFGEAYFMKNVVLYYYTKHCIRIMHALWIEKGSTTTTSTHWIYQVVYIFVDEQDGMNIIYTVSFMVYPSIPKYIQAFMAFKFYRNYKQ